MFSPPSIVLVADDIKLALEMIFRGYNKIVSTYNLEIFLAFAVEEQLNPRDCAEDPGSNCSVLLQ
jgi:hypothetical protein